MAPGSELSSEDISNTIAASVLSSVKDHTATGTASAETTPSRSKMDAFQGRRKCRSRIA